MSANKRVKVIQPHLESCKNQWWWMPGRVEWLDSIGRPNNNGHHRWHVAECNSHRHSNCHASALIREDAICDLFLTP